MRCMKHTDSLNNSPVSSSSGGIPPGSILSDSRPPDRNPTYISIGVNESDLRSSKALYFGVPLVALSVLLGIYWHFPFLPKDGRSLLKTKMEYNVEMIAGGYFHYIGIINAFRNTLRRVCSIFLERHAFNIDSVSLKVLQFSYGLFLHTCQHSRFSKSKRSKITCCHRFVLWDH